MEEKNKNFLIAFMSVYVMTDLGSGLVFEKEAPDMIKKGMVLMEKHSKSFMAVVAVSIILGVLLYRYLEKHD